jgi:Leucine-rich repeat (LRR) protein
LDNFSFLKNLSNPKKITELNITGNNFNRHDLSFLEIFKNLIELHLSDNNFYGSLKSLRNMYNLEKLSISDTDIDSGLEYLSENLKEVYCSNEDETTKKCSSIKNQLEPYNQ